MDDALGFESTLDGVDVGGGDVDRDGVYAGSVFVEAFSELVGVGGEGEGQAAVGSAEAGPVEAVPFDLCGDVEAQHLLVPVGASFQVRHAEAEVVEGEDLERRCALLWIYRRGRRR